MMNATPATSRPEAVFVLLLLQAIFWMVAGLSALPFALAGEVHMIGLGLATLLLALFVCLMGIGVLWRRRAPRRAGARGHLPARGSPHDAATAGRQPRPSGAARGRCTAGCGDLDVVGQENPGGLYLVRRSRRCSIAEFAFASSAYSWRVRRRLRTRSTTSS